MSTPGAEVAWAAALTAVEGMVERLSTCPPSELTRAAEAVGSTEVPAPASPLPGALAPRARRLAADLVALIDDLEGRRLVLAQELAVLSAGPSPGPAVPRFVDTLA